MKPEANSKRLLGVTRSKGKMYEYGVPEPEHITITRNPSNLFPLSLAMLSDLSIAIIGKENHKQSQTTASKDLKFSAYFLDAYIHSKLDSELDDYLSLVAAAAYYLCDLPGSAQVFIRKIPYFDVDFDAQGIERALACLLKDDFSLPPAFPKSPYRATLTELWNVTSDSLRLGKLQPKLISILSIKLRNIVYTSGSAREIFLTNIFLAALQKKIEHSVWTILPRSSKVTFDEWQETCLKETFPRELWPAQRILAQNELFNGASAVIQMPTSAGKTRSIEIIIRSSFLSESARVCVVIAPFRALCHEITDSLRKLFKGEKINVNELTEVFQKDFDTDAIIRSRKKQILVVTPEKLLYVLRQTPALGSEVGLLILDEGHQFDSGARGVTYELLLTSLKRSLPLDAQKVLISAVISNAEDVGTWLNGENGKIIKSSDLAPTFRSTGFASWTSTQGRIEYVQNDNIDEPDFFVPRVIEPQELNKKNNREKQRFYPDKKIGASVAAYLGLKLVGNGPVAIFCGVKSTAPKICSSILDAFARGLELSQPSDFSDVRELEAISYLYAENFGENSIESLSAKLGILNHHASIPNGLRLATEYSIREGLSKFVVCTSTLAQGVNLPIKYLIFTSIYQAGERISVRDFHNLIGRAGRSGMQTEGTILFADPEVYDNRKSKNERWRFNTVRDLMDSSNSEPCKSSLLSSIAPFETKSLTQYRSTISITCDILDILKNYLSGAKTTEVILQEIIDSVDSDSAFDHDAIKRQLLQKIKISATIESFLIAELDEIPVGERLDYAESLAQQTFGYSLANNDEKIILSKLFALIARHIDSKIKSEDTKRIFSKTLLGVAELLKIESWLIKNDAEIHISSSSEEKLFKLIFPQIEKYIHGSDLKKLIPTNLRADVAKKWIAGESFYEILLFLEEKQGKLEAKTQKRKINIHNIVDMCEKGLAFDGMLVVGAIAELVENKPELFNEEVGIKLRILQKRIKYGLPTESSIMLFEFGMSDRVIAQKIDPLLNTEWVYNWKTLKRALTQNHSAISSVLEDYPRYFQEVFETNLSK